VTVFFVFTSISALNGATQLGVQEERGDKKRGLREEKICVYKNNRRDADIREEKRL